MLKPKSGAYLPICIAVIFGVIVTVRARAALNGMASGLETCARVVVPSLFPFLVISYFVAKFGFAGRFADRIMRFLFRLPGDAASAVVFGLFGGFPVGCSTAAQLYKEKRITAEQAQRLTLFCVNAGPGFAVTAVGTAMLGNLKTGAVLFLSLCLSSVITGFLLRFTAQPPERKSLTSNVDVSVSEALVGATEQGAKAMLRICAWVSLFSCGFALLDDMHISQNIKTAVKCVAEVTAGCKSVSQTGNIYAVAATLGWSGLCVLCQVMGDLKCIGTPISAFLAFRAVHAGLSAVLCRVLLCFFPSAVSVFSSFSGQTSAEMFSSSAPAAVALMCLCAVFVVDLDRNRKMC